VKDNAKDLISSSLVTDMILAPVFWCQYKVAVDLYSSMKCCSNCSNPNSLLDIVITRDFDGPRCKLRRSSALVQSSHGSNKHCQLKDLRAKCCGWVEGDLMALKEKFTRSQIA